GSTAGLAGRRPKRTSVYTVKPATTTKITPVMARTKSDTSRIKNAGVETGANMLGVSTTCCTRIGRATCAPTLSCWFCEGLGECSRISSDGSRKAGRRGMRRWRKRANLKRRLSILRPLRVWSTGREVPEWRGVGGSRDDADAGHDQGDCQPQPQEQSAHR